MFTVLRSTVLYVWQVFTTYTWTIHVIIIKYIN